MCCAVVDQVSQNHLPVWYTDVGYVALEEGLLASQKTHLTERPAFLEAELPVIFLPNHVLEEAQQISGSRNLHPRTLYQSLQHMKNVDSLSNPSRLVLLEYLLHGVPLMELGSLELFPFQDGKFRSLKSAAVFLDRDHLEKRLFARDQESTIDTEQLSESSSRVLHERVEHNDRMVRYRNPQDLRSYYLKNIAAGSSDIILLDEIGASMLGLVWRWILKYSRVEKHLPVLGSLWLVPLRGSNVRRLVTIDASNFATWFRPGEVEDVSLKIVALDPENAPGILASESDAVSDEILQQLVGFASKEQSLCIKDGTKLEDFLDFLAHGRTLLREAAEDVKISVLCVLEQMQRWRNQLVTDRECKALKSLCLFKAIRWPANAIDSSLTRYWTDLTSNAVFIGLKKLVPVPASPKQVVLDMTDKGMRELFEESGLVECLEDLQILERMVIPAMQRGSYNSMTPDLRLEVVNLLFQNYYNISDITRSCLPGLPVVPLKQGNHIKSGFVRPLDVLDPQQYALRNLYFEDEINLPEEQFYERFSAVLAECGIVKCLNERVVLDRIQSFGKKGLDFGIVATRARELLKLPFQQDSALPEELTRAARGTKWLPARSPDKSHSLTSSSNCRDITDEPFVGRVWHVLPFQIDKSWRLVLGWQKSIDVDVLISQLVASIGASDLDSVELTYICQHHSIVSCADRLSKLSFVRSSSGELVGAGKVCRRGSERLMPYLYTVEPRFWNDHIDIMKLMNIPEFPSLAQLKDTQKALGSESALNAEDLEVAVEVARTWSLHYPESVKELKMPNDRGMLVDIGGLVFNDTPWLSEGKCAFVHPNVSRTTAEQLMIEPLSELLKNGALGITDPDDDEFYQREEVADGIKDTLDRYTRESTFHEYLANADDCESASEVNFLYDPNNYGTKHLLTKDLQSLQGPALLIHNNGGE